MDSKQSHRKNGYPAAVVNSACRMPRSEMVLPDHPHRHPDCKGHIDTCQCTEKDEKGEPRAPGREWYKQTEGKCNFCETAVKGENALRFPIEEGWLGCYCSLAHCVLYSLALSKAELFRRFYHERQAMIDVDPARFSLKALLRFELQRTGNPLICLWVQDGIVEEKQFLWKVDRVSLIRKFPHLPRALSLWRVRADGEPSEHLESIDSYLSHHSRAKHVIRAFRVSGQRACMESGCTAVTVFYQRRECLHCHRYGSWCEEHGRWCAGCGDDWWCSYCVPHAHTMLCDKCRPQVEAILPASNLGRDLLGVLRQTLFIDPQQLPMPYELGYDVREQGENGKSG